MSPHGVSRWAMEKNLYIGLMSGTSTDGVDAVLADFSEAAKPRILGATSLDMPEALRARLLRLNSATENELELAHLAANELAHLYANACHELLVQQHVAATKVRAIGAHGQTIRHRPELGYSIQLNAPALLAELTQIDVIADFRSRDIAAGGQGAPLVPVVHQGLFSAPHNRVILNLGGIANISVLNTQGPLLGFDTGPANMLMDYWSQLHLAQRYDLDGQWAAKGTLIPQLLEGMLAEPWFDLDPPKSTGRDLFNAAWLHQQLNQHTNQADPQDVQATLLALSVHSISRAIKRHASSAEEVLVCGGGALNPSFMQSLQTQLNIPVRSTTTVGIHPLHVEALAFAWLAYAHLKRIKASAPEITGARHATILGAHYPA